MRQTIQKKLTTEDTIDFTDPTSIDWGSFSFDSGFFEYKLTKDDVYRPYNISYKFYGDTKYTDLILLINNVDDVFNLYVGAELSIPYLEDLENFVLEQKNKNSTEG